jgi:hypothetical protein
MSKWSDELLSKDQPASRNRRVKRQPYRAWLEGDQSKCWPQAQKSTTRFLSSQRRQKLNHPTTKIKTTPLLHKHPTSSKESVTMGFLDILTNAGLTGKPVHHICRPSSLDRKKEKTSAETDVTQCLTAGWRPARTSLGTFMIFYNSIFRCIFQAQGAVVLSLTAQLPSFEQLPIS